ncbi:MAG: hypothetical protein F6K55_03115 [Moorea sp. SIO4A3]|nr:hypothetical protein [Moorena sp. SIO4A3]
MISPLKVSFLNDFAIAKMVLPGYALPSTDNEIFRCVIDISIMTSIVRSQHEQCLLVDRYNFVGFKVENRQELVTMVPYQTAKDYWVSKSYSNNRYAQSIVKLLISHNLSTADVAKLEHNIRHLINS